MENRPKNEEAPEISAALASHRRPAEDRQKDGVRRLAALLAFYQVEPGQHVADLMASRGYLTGALAEIVGDSGMIYAQNSPRLLARFKGGSPIQTRIAASGLTNVRDLVCELEELPIASASLDAVFSFMFYHDTVWVGTDRAAMNAAIFRSLKPGGVFAVVDHHAPAGAGVTMANSHHRIERSVVVNEVTAAGFWLAEESRLLENPADSLDVLVFDKSVRDRTHKFALKFRRPVP
ncbi:MAG: class I SAM-dependent methyltransferase [Gammaproteobacteria bacterium]|nr:class I SAM-dependent methyltransferase [Gammaproteobacteria bacterium]